MLSTQCTHRIKQTLAQLAFLLHHGEHVAVDICGEVQIEAVRVGGHLTDEFLV